MRRRGHLRDLLQQFDLFRTTAELVVADESAEGSAAEDAEFLFVHFLEQGALVKLGSPLQVAQKVLLVDVEHFDLEPLTGFALVHQIFQTAPATFQFLEGWVVHHGIELKGNQMVDLSDARIDHRLGVLRDRDGPFEHLINKFLYQVFTPLASSGVFGHAAFFHDLIEQASLDGLLRALRRRGGFL